MSDLDDMPLTPQRIQDMNLTLEEMMSLRVHDPGPSFSWVEIDEWRFDKRTGALIEDEEEEVDPADF